MTNQDDPRIDPAWLRGMTQRRLSRRELLRYTGAGAGGLGLAALLDACGISGPATSPQPAGLGSPSWWSQQKKTGQVDFANWGYYIDKKKASLDMLTQKTGISVKYTIPIEDNYQFFDIIRPELQAGQGTGYDIVVLTTNSPVLDLVIHKFQWAIPLDHGRTPLFNANASDVVTDPYWDPGNKYTMAWQSGLTAIGYNPKLTGREVTSVHDLFDPKFAGHIGMFDDPQELGVVGLLALGVEPKDSNPDDWHKAAELLLRQRDLVRGYWGQPYINKLENGDTWISMAWSGDVVQSQKNGYTDLKMVVPKEGAGFWTDNMLIPLHAEHPLDALTAMDTFYDPTIAATITDYITYITPVPATKDVILNDLHDPVAANNPLIYPTPEMKSKFKAYYAFKDSAEVNEWNDIFNPIVQG